MLSKHSGHSQYVSIVLEGHPVCCSYAMCYYYIWYMCVVVYITGDEQRCENEGEQVIGDSVSFITEVDPCIKCYCRVSLHYKTQVSLIWFCARLLPDGNDHASQTSCVRLTVKLTRCTDQG